MGAGRCVCSAVECFETSKECAGADVDGGGVVVEVAGCDEVGEFVDDDVWSRRECFGVDERHGCGDGYGEWEGV